MKLTDLEETLTRLLSSILTDLRNKGAVAEISMEDHDESELERTMRRSDSKVNTKMVHRYVKKFE